MRDSDLLARMIASRMRSIELQASGSLAAQSIRSDGVRAVVSPDTPDRWDFNCATYEDQDAFASALPMLDAAFGDAGVAGWAVRVPDADRELAALLGTGGFQPESHGFAMGRELDGPIAVPELDASISTRREWDLEAVGRLMDLGSGDQPGEWFRALGALDPGDAFLYMVARDGVPFSFLLGHDHGEDSPHWFAATAASERRQGLGRQAILSALRDGQRRGSTSSTSHATASGARLAESCGYRRLAAVTAWVRRFDSPQPDGAPRAARAPARAGGR